MRGRPNVAVSRACSTSRSPSSTAAAARLVLGAGAARSASSAHSATPSAPSRMPTSIHWPPTRSAHSSASRTCGHALLGPALPERQLRADAAPIAAPIWKSRCHSERSSAASRAASASLPRPTITWLPTAASRADTVLDTRRPGGSAAASLSSQSPRA